MLHSYQEVVRKGVGAVALLVAASLVAAGCAQTAPAPTPTKAPPAPTKAAEPTKAPAAPTKAAEPTKAPAPQPTAVPAKKVDFPQKGKAVTVIIPFGAGGSTDVGGRLVASALEKEFGTPFQVVNRVGGGAQTGTTELVLAKPDGYTIGYTNLPTTITLYLDPQRKATFTRSSFQPIVGATVTAQVVAVKADSPHKTLKDLLDAAKAKPGGVKFGVGGILTVVHLISLQLEKLAGVEFATVQFEGGNPTVTALLGGHVDAAAGAATEMLPHARSGALRVLGVADKEESKAFPDVKTLESQGYKINMATANGISAPAGTPKEIVDVLAGAIKKALADEEMKKKLAEAGMDVRYMDATQFGALWADMETEVKPLMTLVRR